MALYFSKEDADSLKERKVMLEVIDRCGTPYQIIGGKKSILCPAHDDKHFGSCIVSSAGAYCFPCGKFIRPIEFLTKYNGYKYYEALSLIAEIEGETSYYERKRENKTNKPTAKPGLLYSWKDHVFLFLKDKEKAKDKKWIEKKYSFMPFETNEKLSKMPLEDGSILYIEIERGGNPLSTLEREDPEAFRYLMTQKAKEKMVDAVVTYDLLKNKTASAPSILREAESTIPEEGLAEILETLKETYERATTILKKYGEKVPSIKEIIAEEYVLQYL